MKKIKATLMQCNQLTSDGRVYSLDAIKEDIERLNSSQALGTLTHRSRFDNVTELCVDDAGDVTGEFELLDVEGNNAQRIDLNDYSCQVRGFKTFNKDNEIESFEPVTVELLPKEQCSCIGTSLEVVEDE